MKFFLALFLVIFTFTPKVFAYSQDQLNDCVLSAQKNPTVKNMKLSSLEGYCDCALKLIVDEGKDLRDSGYECALKHFAD